MSGRYSDSEPRLCVQGPQKHWAWLSLLHPSDLGCGAQGGPKVEVGPFYSCSKRLPPAGAGRRDLGESFGTAACRWEALRLRTKGTALTDRAE